jgi:hypothetical protein
VPRGSALSGSCVCQTERKASGKGRMTNSLKGALLSGLVLPGLGQVFLKHYKRGAVLILTVLVSLSVIVMKAVQHALVVLEKIESEGGAITMHSISKATARASSTFDSVTVSFFTLLIILCWIIGIIDAYRIGKKRDIAGASSDPT